MIKALILGFIRFPNYFSIPLLNTEQQEHGYRFKGTLGNVVFDDWRVVLDVRNLRTLNPKGLNPKNPKALNPKKP